jgi:predicted MFS family arabinose efflux permease
MSKPFVRLPNVAYRPPVPERDVAALYVRWVAVRAALARGWWLVTSLYLVVEAGLTPFQLVFVGTAQGITALAAEIPTGVLADALGRKRSIVVAHLLIGAGMTATGLVTAFPALVATQMLWGLGWTFTSGADVAWLTDELDRPERTAVVLTAGARAEQIGAAAGMVAFGGLAWAAGLTHAIVAAGLAMWALGAVFALRFPETRFAPAREGRFREAASILRRGAVLARSDRAIVVILAATALVNGAAEGFGRLFAKRLVDLGLPASPDPIVWLTALGLVALALGAAALRMVETRIDGVGAARRTFVAASACGALGLVVLGFAPDPLTAMAGVLLVQGIAFTVIRCVSVIWVNRRVTTDVRATVQSFLSQAEYLGEITLGFGLGVLAQAAGIPSAMLGACALVVAAGVCIAHAKAADA